MKINQQMKTTMSLAVAAMACITTTSTEGAVIQAVSSNASQTFYSALVSDSDLLHGLTGVASGVAWTASPATLNDGLHGGVNSGHAWAKGNTPPAPAVTYILGTGDNGLGYDITQITSFAAWQTWAAQSYTIELQPKDGSFALLDTVFFDSFGAGTDEASMIELTDDSGPLLATGIVAIRFTQVDGLSSPQSGSLYRELDVFGTSTVVPEPSSLALLGLGGLALILRRRK